MAYVLADQFVVDLPAPVRGNLIAAANAQTSPDAAPVSAGDAAPAAAAGAFGIGREALPEEVAAWNIDIRPDGQGLPEGRGDVWTGEEVYVENCAMCHGDFGEAVGRWPMLAGGRDTLTREDPVKTIGSFWPYLSTVFDYVHRAMPFGAAQSLTPDEVYAITAYLLYVNDIVEDDFELSHENFAEVRLPNEDGFFMDDRPETELVKFSGEPCMENCKDGVEITMRASVLDVTPGDSTDDAVEAGAEADADTGGAAEGAVEAAAPAAVDGSEADASEADASEAAGAEADASEAPGAEAAEAAADASDPDPALVAAGEAVFRKCSACHQVGEGATNRVGPHLNGVFGRTAGSVEGFRYSDAMRAAGEAGLAWTQDEMAAFLADPRGYMPGTKMSFAGLRNGDDVAAVNAYLQSQGE